MTAENVLWPWWPVTFTVGLTAIALRLHARAADNDRPGSVRVGVVAATAVLFALPTATVLLTQELECDVTGFGERVEGQWALAGVMVLVLLVALAPLAQAAGEAPGRIWRLPLLAGAVLVPAAVVEALLSLAALHGYCDSRPGLLQAQAALALTLPALLVAQGRWWQDSASFAVRAVVVAAGLVLLLPAQVGIVVVRAGDAPLVCATAGRLDLAARDAVGGRGPDTDQALAAADYDEDGSVDLAAVDESTLVLHQLRNDGRGDLRPGAEARMMPGFFAVGPVAAADVDGNGQTDVVVTGFESARPPVGRSRLGAVATVVQDGAALRPSPPLFLEDDEVPRDLAVGDMDGNGAAEVVVIDGTAAAVFRTRDGRLETVARLSALPPRRLWRLALADADGDGRTDVLTLVLGDPGARSEVILHRNAGPGRFETSVIATIDDYVVGFEPADFDGDGDVDVVTTGRGERWHVLDNRGGGRFELRAERGDPGSEEIVAADVDGDGRLDAVLSATYSSEAAKWPGDLWVRLSRGGWEFSPAEHLARPRDLLAVADLDGDRRVDFVLDDLPDVTVLRTIDCG